ncbi:MAG: hypothetical protein JRI46_11685 [Deltaproteobacteria bacterium]|nr:hypothetical protein [Deltaproteobacteria bacterium]
MFTIHYKNKRFQGERIELDGKEFSRCEFRDCLVVLERGETQIKDCRFYNCKLMLRSNAYTIAKIITAVTGSKPLKVLDIDEPLFLERPEAEGGG